MLDYTRQIEGLLDACNIQLSTVKPSEWAEQNRMMDSSVSPFPGPFRFDKTPYTREILDCLSPDHPARILAIMKGAQAGFSASVIENAIGWIISQSPGNILFLTGHADLSEEAMVKIDQMIDSCGIRSYIRANVQRAKSMKTGDTNLKKEFPGGSLVAGSAGNHKLLRQRSVRYGFIDDYEAAKVTSKESGSTQKMIEQRFAAYYDKMKLFYISTPELKQSSNILTVYLLGDQRKYHIPCPCCGEFIILHWSIEIKGTDGKELGGITWKIDDQGKLVEDSVGYVCQECGGFFTDKNKYELNLAGHWKPTAEPSEPGYYSYHVSSLYAPHGMYDWRHYVRQYLQANPPNEPQKTSEMKAFTNLVLGECWEDPGESPKANQLQKNIRKYEVGTIPEKLSERDGNGKIVLLTCACDLNGIPEDARLDYEIVGWSESGASYSIKHGSIGTFVPREGSMKNKADRERWTYEHHKPNSVWPEFNKVLEAYYSTDTKRRMKIFITGVDTGQYNIYAYPYIDNSNFHMVALKGDKEDKAVRFGVDLPKFKPSRERSNLYLLQVNKIKDDLADMINLRWDEGNDDHQPSGFMNFPTPSNGLYLYNNYFAHFESEHRIIETQADGTAVGTVWQKKTSIAQNHLWDCRVYNMAVRDILVAKIFKELAIKDYTWKDYADKVMGR